MLGYIIEHFEKYIKESEIQETVLDDNPVPENMGRRPNAIDDYLKEMLLEAKKSRKLEQDWSLEKIQQKVLNDKGTGKEPTSTIFGVWWKISQQHIFPN